MRYGLSRSTQYPSQCNAAHFGINGGDSLSNQRQYTAHEMWQVEQAALELGTVPDPNTLPLEELDSWQWASQERLNRICGPASAFETVVFR